MWAKGVTPRDSRGRSQLRGFGEVGPVLGGGDDAVASGEVDLGMVGKVVARRCRFSGGRLFLWGSALWGSPDAVRVGPPPGGVALPTS